MLKLYEKYLEVIDNYLQQCFLEQKPFIHCKSGCTDCCETGEYPFSRLEMEYLMAGFVKLPAETQQKIKKNITELLANKPSDGKFLHRCPFLIDSKCALYERRGIICRTFGLAAFDEINGQKVVKLPQCCKIGLNYSEIYDRENSLVDMEKFNSFGTKNFLPHPPDLNYMIKELTKGIDGLEFGEIRPLLEWFKQK